MKRISIAQTVSKTTGIPVKDVERVIIEANKTIINGVAAGESVFLRKFGTFGSKSLKAKKARDFKNQSTMLIPARTKVFFKPSPTFNEAVVDTLVTENDIKQLYPDHTPAA